MVIISGISPKSDNREREKWTFQGTHLYRYHRNQEKWMELKATEEQALEIPVSTFLADLAHANHSPQTLRAYASDLAQLCAFHHGPLQTITVEVLRKFFEKHAHLRPATRARKQAAVARFLTWAEQAADAEVRAWRRLQGPVSRKLLRSAKYRD
jgi:Phage integrase, N-terminal SAM-like domain